jgi:hypothetical protein
MLLVPNWCPRLSDLGPFFGVFGPAIPFTNRSRPPASQWAYHWSVVVGRLWPSVRDGRALGQERAREGVPEIVYAKAVKKPQGSCCLGNLGQLVKTLTADAQLDHGRSSDATS